MATTTFLSNATINITQGVTSYDLSDQANASDAHNGPDCAGCNSIRRFWNTHGRWASSVECTIDFFLSYGTDEVEAALAAMVGQGNTTLVISPSGATESASNPEYTISNCMLESFTPINSTVGELATVTANFVAGTWARDITPD
jgi:hypothetical protein